MNPDQNQQQHQHQHQILKQSCFSKLINRIFPVKYPDAEEVPEGFTDGYDTLTIKVRLDFLDLLKLAFTRRFRIEVIVRTDVGVNKSFASSEFSVMPPKWTDLL